VTLTFESDLGSRQSNQHGKYLSRSSCKSNVNMRTHIHTDIRPIDLSGPLRMHKVVAKSLSVEVNAGLFPIRFTASHDA